MHRFALLARSCCSLFALFAYSALGACTEPQSDDGPEHLVRQVPDSSGNFALSFDGVDDYATTGTAEFPTARAAQTISAWFQIEAVSGKHALITLRKDGDSCIELGLQDGAVGAWRVHANRLILAPSPVTVGVWHHVAYTFDATTHQLFVDGVLVASSEATSDDRTATSCWLGTLDGTNDLFKGSIDDFRVFNVVRTSAQIAAEAAGGFSSRDGLVLDLPCNESSGNLVYDHSPLGNDGLLGDGVDQRKPARVSSGAPND